MNRYFKTYKLRTTLIVLGVICLSGVTVGTSLIHTFAFDALLNQSLVGFLSWYGIGLGLWLVLILGNYALKVARTALIQDMSTMLRTEYAHSVASQTLVNYKAKDVGEYVSFLNNDIKLIETSGFDSVFNIVSTMSLTFISLLTLWSFDVRIMFITIVLAWLLTVIPNFLTKRITKATASYSDSSASFVNKITDFLSGYETLYYLGNKFRLSQQVENTSSLYKEAHVRYVKDNGVVNALISLLSVCSQIIVMGSTGYFAYLGIVSFGAMTSTSTVAANVFHALSNFSQYRMNIKSVKPLLEKIENTHAQPTLDVTEGFEMMVMENVSMQYQDHVVFDDLDLVIEKGKKYAMIGASGSGKSTLLQIMLGNETNYSGSVRYNNRDLKTMTSDALMDHFAFIGNAVHIYQDTLYNNITLWETVVQADVSEALKKANLTDFEPRLQEVMHQNMLSEGQKQRIGLARAFLKKRAVYVFDEATAHLDALNSEWIEDVLLHQDDITFISVTHHLKEERKHLYHEVISLSN